MRALHSLYRDALETMDARHVNHFERDGVLPIAFSLFHIANMIDASFMLITGTPPIWDDRWQARVAPAIADHGKHRSVAELDRVVVARPLPEQLASTFSARVAGPEGITVLDALECWIYQHGLRHLGEIELARGLVGLGGLTS